MSILTRTLIDVLENNIDTYVNKINEVLPRTRECKVHANQVRCAVEAIMQFNANKPRPNHIIIKAPTQSGKTGVFTAIIRLINILQLPKTMQIDVIYYLTGDNTSALKEQTLKRVSKCFNETFECKFIALKNSDMQKELKSSDSNNILKNALIFIDESHYGSNSDNHILNKWLQSKGRDLHNTKALLDDSVYVISNSATPYKEIFSDLANTKAVVELNVDRWNEETQSGYVGFEEYYSIGAFADNVKFSISSRNCEKYFKSFREHVDSVKARTGKDKCGLIRIVESNTIKKVRDVAEKYFEVEVYSGKNGNVRYSDMENQMSDECGAYDKPLLFIVQGAYRQGKTIKPEAKRNICFIFDYAPECETTEQGLFGRLCGYTFTDDWKDLMIWINHKHTVALRNCYVEKKCSTPINTDGPKKFVPNENGKENGFRIHSEYGIITYSNVPKLSDEKGVYIHNLKKYLEGIDDKYKELRFVTSRRNSEKNKTIHLYPVISYKAIKDHGYPDILSDEALGSECYYTLYDEINNEIQVMFCVTCKGDFKLVSEVNRKTYKPYETYYTE